MIFAPSVVPGRPNDQRGFIHKKLLGGISKIAKFVPIPGSDLISQITGRLAGGGRAAGRALVPRTTTARVTTVSQAEKEVGRQLKFSEVGSTTGPCNPPLVRGPTGLCVFAGSPLGSDPALGIPGQAVMGQYGAGEAPGSMIVDRAVCRRGMQLGNDGLCYNKSQISNRERMWPAGRKPLLTGGDMRAISTAARAGRRLELATKRLQKMGMMKRPARRAGGGGHRALLTAHATK